MNRLNYKGLSVPDRVVAYFELARDATLMRTYAEMITAALALIYLLQDAEVNNKRVANHLRKEAARCNITDTAVMNAIDDIEKGGAKK